MPREQRRLAAILFADVVGSSRLMGRDESGTVARLLEHLNRRLAPAAARFGGRVIKLTGDGGLVEFGSAVDALRAAIEFQQAMIEANRGQSQENAIVFRTGLHLGDVIVEGDDIYGDDVNVAARLEAEAPPGGIVVSRAVRDAVKGRLKAALHPLGDLTLKNIARPIPAFRVEWSSGDWPAIEVVPDPAFGPPASRQPKSEPTPTALPLPDKPSIAVLAFENMSGDSEQEYFADGVVEDIITALSRIHWFFVIARNSSFAYKGKVVDVRVVARELGVHYVLEGSVRKGGDRLRITAQLVDAGTGNCIWVQRYDREVADIFELQDEITSNVVATIEPQLYAAEYNRAKRKPLESLDAWDCVARGLSHILRMTKHDNATAQELLRKAIAIDASYAQAHSLLAFSLSLANSWGWQQSENVLGPAWDAAQKAIRLDIDNPWAHLALGHIHRQRLELQDAIAEFQNAILLNPNFAFAHTHLGLALCFQGRSREALVELDTAERLSPRDFQAGLNDIGRAIACFIDGRYRDGIDFARKAVRQSPDTAGAHHLVVVNSALAGAIGDARAAFQSLKRLEPDLSLATLDIAVYARDEDRRRYREAFRLAGLE